MPAGKFTKLARGKPKLSRQWAHVRASEIKRGASPGKADMIANGVVKRESGKRKKRGGKR